MGTVRSGLRKHHARSLGKIGLWLCAALDRLATPDHGQWWRRQPKGRFGVFRVIPPLEKDSLGSFHSVH